MPLDTSANANRYLLSAVPDTFDIQAALSEALSGESEWSEWKENDSEGVVRAACAFANDLGDSGRPGYILIGVKKNGEMIGVDTSDEAIQRVVNRLTSTKILPNPSCNVHKAVIGSNEILVVKVEPFAVPPVVRVNQVAYVRVGTSTRRASDADLTRMNERRPVSHQPFDIRPLSDVDLDALDVRKLRELYESARQVDGEGDTYPGFERWLGQNNLARQIDGAWSPTSAAVLVYGLDPLSYFPGARVEFARYDGVDVDSAVIARRSVTGDLPGQLETLWTQLNANNAEVPAGEDGIRTQYLPAYPLEALKELARNLIQHRQYEGTNAPARISWFADRIEFNNPGGPFGQAKQGEFGEHTDYRNPTITNLLVDLGYVERLGRGIFRVRKLLEKNSNPALEVRTDGFTVVTVWSRA
jgi:ATP-dependent DNA helicase RecG